MAVIDIDASRRSEIVEVLGDVDGVDVLAPVDAKGLEFDGVVIVEPRDMESGPGGWRPLFVALTRAVQHLELVGAKPLPEQLMQPFATG